MRTRIITGTTLTLAAILAIALAANPAPAAVIFADDFSGSAGTGLNGTTPDVTTGVAWVAPTLFGADGAISGPLTNFSLAAVPEPSAALLGLGGFALLRRRRSARAEVR